MRPEEIESILKRLENGEISEDDSTDNEDDIDYYSSQRDRLMELEEEEDVVNFPTDPDLDANPLAANVDTDMQHNLETDERSITPTTSSQNNLQTAPFNSRNLVWRVKNMDIVQNAFQFAGNTEYSQEIMNLDTPFQFFSYFFDEEMFTFLVDESNKYAFQKNPNFTEPTVNSHGAANSLNEVNSENTGSASGNNEELRKESPGDPCMINNLLKYDQKFITLPYDNKFNVECLFDYDSIKLRHFDTNSDKNELYVPPLFMYMRSEWDIHHVLEEFEVLLQNETVSISCDQVDQLMNQVDTLLEEKSSVVIPGNLLMQLDELGTRLQLENQTGKVVRNNFAVILADVTPGMGVRGLHIVGDQDDPFTSDRFQFFNGSVPPMSEETEAVVWLPESATEGHRRLSFVAFRTDHAFHPNHTCQLNSKVLGVSVEHFTGFHDGEMIEIYLNPISRDIQRNQSVVCAYWHFGENGTGYWSQDGCTLTVSEDGKLDVCRCDHLTHFALIIINRSVFSEGNEKALEIISVVGCSLSIFGITLVVITAALFKNWRKNESNKIWLHLCSAVLLLNICFLVSVYVQFQQSDIWCSVAGGTLHYSVLVTYCWMLVISILSYRKLVLVFNSDIRRKLIVSSTFSWGFPILVIGILLAVDNQAYSGQFEEMTPSGHFCYPKGIAFFVTVYLPIGVMWFINCCLYGIILRSMAESRSLNITKHSKSNDSLRAASSSCLLAFICGIPWVSGFFASNIVGAYIFTITVTFQGFVLFLFFVVANSRTRKMWVNLFRSGLRRGHVTSSGVSNRSPQTSSTRFHTDSTSVPLRERMSVWRRKRDSAF